MKLKNILIISFLTLTLIPIVIVSLLLYKSSYELSKESYLRNLIESIPVQSYYMAQTIENNMVTDYRFARKNILSPYEKDVGSQIQSSDLNVAFQSYLEISEDKITACLLLDKENMPVYTIGEAAVLEKLQSSLPPLAGLERQLLMEFELKPGIYSLGIVTPISDTDGIYSGCLISIYEQDYLFKMISSYYKIADTSIYICKENGDVINFRGLSDKKQNTAIEMVLTELSFTDSGVIDERRSNVPVSGYYQNIGNSPWYLVGFIDKTLVTSFANQYILTYILIITGVLIVDILLAFYFSNRVVEPINSLIRVMEGYPGTLNSGDLQAPNKKSYFETQYLRKKFLELMKRILLVQHNFEGIYQLYQSGDMSDTNIDIDTKEQTITSNKDVFQKLMNQLEVPKEACIVERFINCFCEKDKKVLMDIFDNMRVRHLSVPCEAEVYTPHLDKKWFHTLIVPMYENDRLSHLFVQLRDISSFKKQEMESIEEARRDSLTGLYNRSGFLKGVEEGLRTKEGALHGILFLDMDYFKMVNDNLGHSAGDDLLQLVGRTLLDTIGPCGIVSRFGGDEFAVFLPDTDQEEISSIKEELTGIMIYPFHTESISFVVTASIGFSIWDRTSANTLDEILQQADTAMYQAKKRVKSPGAEVSMHL